MVDLVTHDPAVRLLQLLSLLQVRSRWSPQDLADRLEVSPRTLRRDMRRLEELDYRIASRPGPGGFYALAPGTRVPPLTFDDDEVVALIVGLRMVEGRAGGDQPGRALAKLLQVLPPRLGALARVTAATSVSAARRPPTLDLATLRALAEAGDRARSVAFHYEGGSGAGRREVDSIQCIESEGEWYLLGFDLGGRTGACSASTGWPRWSPGQCVVRERRPTTWSAGC